MSWTTNIPQRAKAIAYACAILLLAANAALLIRSGTADLLPAAILAALGLGLQKARQMLSSITSVSLCDVPLIIAVLTISPGMAMLVGVIVGVVPRGRFGSFTRAGNVVFYGLPAGAAASLFVLLRDLLGAGVPQASPITWFVAAITVVTVHIALNCIAVDLMGHLAFGHPFWQNLREVGLPVARYDVVAASLTATLVQITLMLDGRARLLPLVVAIAGGAGLWLFLSATRKQLQSQALKDEFFRAIFVSFARLLEMKDPDTAIHSARVAVYSRDIAKEMGLSPEDQSRIHLAGLLHDVGKVGVPDEILLKPGRLTDAERAIMQRHARLSAEALQGIPGFGDLARMIYAHHERLDGSGYPEGTAGDELPLGARILGVADTFEALTSNRPYRLGRSAAEALIVFDQDSHLFDDGVVEALRGVVRTDSTTSAYGKVTDFSDEWSRAAKLLDVRLDEDVFVVPPNPECATDEVVLAAGEGVDQAADDVVAPSGVA